MTSPGQTLRQARESRAIRIEAVARDTRIRLPYLQAIENGDLKRLPAGAFARGFVRTYAAYLGLDPAPLVEAYLGLQEVQAREGRLDPEPDLLSAMHQRVEGKKRTGLGWAPPVVAAAVVAAGLGLWVGLARFGGDDESGTSAESAGRPRVPAAANETLHAALVDRLSAAPVRVEPTTAASPLDRAAPTATTPAAPTIAEPASSGPTPARTTSKTAGKPTPAAPMRSEPRPVKPAPAAATPVERTLAGPAPTVPTPTGPASPAPAPTTTTGKATPLGPMAAPTATRTTAKPTPVQTTAAGRPPVETAPVRPSAMDSTASRGATSGASTTATRLPSARPADREGQGLVATPSDAAARSAATAPAEPGRLAVAESGVGLEIDGGRLVGESDRFAPGTAVYFWTRVVGGKRGDTLRHAWIHDGVTVGTVILSIGGSHWRTQSRRLLGATGSWAVEARDGAGRVLARRDFTCALAH